MTTYQNITKKCVYCGKESEQTLLTSYNQTGYPSLDCRAERMGVDPLYMAMDKCPHCNYAAPDISQELPGLDSKIFESKEFKDLVEKYDKKWPVSETSILSFFNPNVVTSYLIFAYLNESINNYGAAASCYLNASWILDDKNDIESANKARKKAVSNFLKLNGLDVTSSFQVLDLLRRSCEFDEALEFLKPLEEKYTDDDIFHAMVVFQKELIKNKDSTNYTTLDAMEFFNKEKNGDK